jgi:hypothetical protein
MENKKTKILDFFFDGDIIIAGPQEYTNISKVLETEEYKFITNDNDSDLKDFFMHVLLESSIREGNTINMVLRVPYGKRDIQKELSELIQAQEIFGSDKCTWSVIEDIYNQTKIQVGILAYSPTE